MSPLFNPNKQSPVFAINWGNDFSMYAFSKDNPAKQMDNANRFCGPIVDVSIRDPNNVSTPNILRQLQERYGHRSPDPKNMTDLDDAKMHWKMREQKVRVLGGLEDAGDIKTFRIEGENILNVAAYLLEQGHIDNKFFKQITDAATHNRGKK